MASPPNPLVQSVTLCMQPTMASRTEFVMHSDSGLYYASNRIREDLYTLKSVRTDAHMCVRNQHFSDLASRLASEKHNRSRSVKTV